MPQQDEDIHPEAAVAPGYLANHAAKVFNRLVDNVLRPHDLSMALIGPVLLLSWKGPMLQRDIVRSSAIKQPAMVALLDKLEAMDLVVRTPSECDRRAALVELSEKGIGAAAIGRKVLIETNRQGLQGFSRDEADLMITLFQRLIANFER